MRIKAATAVVMALAWFQVCPEALLAKPTRAIPHPATRKLVVVESSSRGRATHKTAAAREGSHPATHANTGNTSRNQLRTSTPERNTAHHPATSSRTIIAADRQPARTHSPLRTPDQERSLAARAAITAADHGIRVQPETPFNSDTSLASNTDAPTNVVDVLATAPLPTRLKSIEEEASTPILLPPLRVSSLYDSHGRLILPAPLYGSHEILLHQNQMADRDGLDRVRNDADLLDLRRQNKLVALPESEALRVDFRLPEDRRFSRPWTAAFLSVLSRDYYASFHTPLQVDSAVRTVAVQQRLTRTNGNAAPSSGETASPHLTGQAVDIAKGGLSRIQIAWMRTYLQPLIGLGKIDVEEEFQQSCFHISVYKNFLPASPSRFTVTAARQPMPEPLP